MQEDNYNFTNRGMSGFYDKAVLIKEMYLVEELENKKILRDIILDTYQDLKDGKYSKKKKKE